MILSKDYKKLFEFVMANEKTTVPCFVDYKFKIEDEQHVIRDVAGVCYRYEHIDIGVRGYGYGGVYGKELNEEEFIKECERMNLEFVD